MSQSRQHASKLVPGPMLLLDACTPVRSSLDLVRSWSISSVITPKSPYTVLYDIRTRGNDVPGRGHPRKPWWDAATDDD